MTFICYHDCCYLQFLQCYCHFRVISGYSRTHGTCRCCSLLFQLILVIGHAGQTTQLNHDPRYHIISVNNVGPTSNYNVDPTSQYHGGPTSLPTAGQWAAIERPNVGWTSQTAQFPYVLPTAGRRLLVDWEVARVTPMPFWGQEAKGQDHESSNSGSKWQTTERTLHASKLQTLPLQVQALIVTVCLPRPDLLQGNCNSWKTLLNSLHVDCNQFSAQNSSMYRWSVTIAWVSK